MKFGFELELFCLNQEDKPILVPAGLPFDACGWLVEVRSEPHHNLRYAIHLLRAELEKVQEDAIKKGVKLLLQPTLEIPRELKVEARRQYKKELIQYRNVYGHQTHRCKPTLGTAALHISFTNQVERVKEFRKTDWTVNGKFIEKMSSVEIDKFTYQGFIDHARIVVGLDKAFANEIKGAGRNPGFYEVKGDGRIEYRSLPNNVDLSKVYTELVKLV